MANKKGKPAQPPQAPTIETKFEFHLFQLIGVPLMMLIPILALFGLFGETGESVSASSEQLEMEVEYPTRFRYKMIDSITVSLFNSSSQELPSVTVNFDQDYIEQFSTVTFTPSIKSVTEDSYTVELTNLQPGETRLISVTIQAEDYGMHEGTITAATEGADPLQVTLGTFAFP